jgi:hypothetical protein
MKRFEAELLKDDWTQVRPDVEVKQIAIPQGEETYILCRTQLHALAAIFDPGPQKRRTQMLLHGSGADVQLLGCLLVAVAFDQKVQNRFIASRNLDIAEIQHGVSSLLVCETLL